MDQNIDIQRYLPHRSPMLMVDVIREMDSRNVVTEFKIAKNNIFVSDGYFSEPGLIENAAQTCSAIVAKGYFVDNQNNDKENVDVIGFISAIKSLKILGLPKAGSSIVCHSVLESQFDTEEYSLCTMKCETRSEGILLLEGLINLFIRDNAKPMEAASKSNVPI